MNSHSGPYQGNEKQDSDSQSQKQRYDNQMRGKENMPNGNNNTGSYQQRTSVSSEQSHQQHNMNQQQQQYQPNTNQSYQQQTSLGRDAEKNRQSISQQQQQQQQQDQPQQQNMYQTGQQSQQQQASQKTPQSASQQNQQTTYNKSDTHTHMYKIVLVGDAGVGKTHIINRYVKGQLPHAIIPTIGIEFATKTVTLRDGGTIKTQIWDTAGQEKYRSITSAHYRKAVGALLVYDVTKEKSFESIQRWLEEIRLHADKDIVLMLVGNKVDLIHKNPEQRKVSKIEATNFAKQNGLLFEESSALFDVNINDVFERLLEEIYDQKCRLQSERSLIQTEVDDVKKGNKTIDLNLPNAAQPAKNSICSCG
ncbi:hypothetical protein ABPG74_000167 [Tetrahymena malaccensis]